ncbi:sialate O-acetylesterase [Neorhodopirellula lusitana]|uniref:sialate O-acetylesterase n=1 Tax=Neorhodopirellula lusitana TaxID=445327 RepID=UPI0038514158
MIRCRAFCVLLMSCLLHVNGISSHQVAAEVRLPSVFADHMVIQQQRPIRVWGWAEPGEAVSVAIGESQASATADKLGQWEATLPAMDASKQSHQITVNGSTSITLKDVLIGEVWVCSGQSNMAWTVQSSDNAAEEIANANHPLIRHITVPRKFAVLPQDDFQGSWQVCSPSTVGGFTAAGYFMGRTLNEKLDIPIGLINSSWGGTRIDPWTSLEGWSSEDSLKSIHQSALLHTPNTSQHRERIAQHVETTQAWLDAAKQSLANQAAVPAQPPFPAEIAPYQNHQDPTVLYNAMIHPIERFPIRGAIWYQGESNHNEGMLYRDKMQALLHGWRERWGQGDFPFYFVQIAPYQYGTEDPTILARFWEAQEAAAKTIPNAGMVVINDVGNVKNIHPTNKQAVGKRLAKLALKNDYGFEDIVAVSPQFESLRTEGNQLVVKFSNTGGGLKTRDGKSPTHFEIIGASSGGFHEATATIQGDSVVLQSDRVKEPVAFRFAWNKIAEPNLAGGTGLPVGAVRGGEVPSFVNRLPLDDYKLVYDLDLNKLGSKIQYDVDQSESVDKFSRVAYLVELVTEAGDTKSIFVSIDAFTDDASQLGVPTVDSKAMFQSKVQSVVVQSNSNGTVESSELKAANLEFWPHNYGAPNGAKVKGASSSVYDFGDAPSDPVNGYGSMQVHDTEGKKTLFAINSWRSGKNADVGIGNSPGKNTDWTFAKNASDYPSKRLRVFVK